MTEVENDHNIRLQSEISSSSRQSANADTTSDNHQELMNSQLELKYGPENIVKLCAPVSLCIFIVVFTINNVKFFTTKDLYLVYTPFHEESKDSTTILWNSLANSLILMTVVIVMTMLLIFLYKYKFYKIISIWLILSSLMLLFIFTYMYFLEFLVAFNYPMDYVTALLFLWNFGVVGIISIHLSGPVRLQQMYLIFISALMALVFIKYMPEFTTWVVLAVMSIWDLYAVLTPKGPLRVLVETAQERNDAIFPSLIYSSNIMTIDENGGEEGPQQAIGEEGEEEQETEGFSQNWVDGQKRFRNPNEDRSEVADNLNARPNYIFENRNEAMPATEKGVKLGLGDFIFYSVLVGKASCVSDWNVPLACYIAILMGLILTMVLLAMFRKALPALPISITFGLIMYFTSVQFIKPFVDQLAANQIFI